MASILGQAGRGPLRDILKDYVDWLLARPKIRERIPGRPSAERARRPAIF